MALMQALSTGISGLNSHQTAMDNLGHNLANINTTGYKKGVHQFATLLEQTMRGGMGAHDGRGSVNPIGMGMGTLSASISRLFTQGDLEPTGSFNDMAINGEGFFVLQNARGGYQYTRDGSFKIDQDGFLVNSAGLYVQGTNSVKRSDGSVEIPEDARLERLRIPLKATGGMSKTSAISFAGNISSNQKVASGLRLYGSAGTSVNDHQSWMPKNPTNTDSTWTSLEQETYVISQEMVDLAVSMGVELPGNLASNVSTYGSGMAVDPASQSSYYAIDPATGRAVDVSTRDANNNRVPANVGDLLAQGMVPATQQISMINGGNVQTSAALGIRVPEYLRQGSTVQVDGRSFTVQNSTTYPAWFYESNGGDFAAAAAMTDDDMEANPGAAWPNGFQGSALNPTDEILTMDQLPRPTENYAATLDTPLEHIYYYNGNQWTKMFDNLKEGDEITIGFDKGGSTISSTFTYNYPSSPPPFGSQEQLDIEKSYTLEHFLTFMGGDVDQPGAAAVRITPAMFGAPVTEAFPDGDPNDAAFDKNAYEDALANVSLATSDRNLGMNGGVMGLIDLPPSVGNDVNKAPMETAGAFTRQGVSKAEYLRWDAMAGDYRPTSGESFNVSLVSNLGSQNALSNISITHNSSTLKSVFSEEKEYAAAEGGSATTDVVIYDSLGNAKTATLRLALVSEDSNFSTWRWYADSQDDTDFNWMADENGNLVSNLSVGTGLIRFDSDGNFVAGSETSETGGIVINQLNKGVDDPIVVRVIDRMASGQDLDFSELTQNSRPSDLSTTQNGSAPGTLDKYEVGENGIIYGVYSTGSTVLLGRLVLGTVANPHGLTSSGGNLFETGPASGEMQYGFAGLGGRGAIKQYNLESSNVEMSEEFTRMISLQRGFQANTRVITTADEMLQELLSLKR